MERSTTFLTYKGTISEAIIEAQKQKKLFLIFISGEDENSTNLENSTWLDDKVASAVSRYCIFLHLIQGHIEALQFSAIYPQKSVPSISAVGFNGIMLWQHEGYIDGQNFVLSIEKAWAAMLFQDSAAALMSTVIASKKPESSSSIDVASTEQGEPSSFHDSLALANNEALNDKEKPPKSSKSKAKQQLSSVNTSKVPMEDRENEGNETPEIFHSEAQNMQKLQALPQGFLSNENHSKSSLEPIGTIDLSSKSPQIEAIKTTTIHLSIRLPSGVSLQEKFDFTNSLRSVKTYVDENSNGNWGSYDLAIPYPRKVFGEDDMSKALCELGLALRQALILIPKTVVQTSANQPSSSDSKTEGYFGYLKGSLSYLNPFSYFGGFAGRPSSSEEASTDDLRQYSPKSGLHSSSAGQETSFSSYSPNPHNTNASGTISRRTSRSFSGNIHTLRREEDDQSSRDRNTFWNGNSTQYGGNDKQE